MGRTSITSLALLALATALATPPALGAPIGPEGPPQPLSLSISGGVSLGAYEAGSAWAFARYLRAWDDDRSGGLRPEDGRVSLVGITGASAGAINALMTALAWCQSTERVGTVDDNLIRNSWLSVGFDGLLPADPATWPERFAPLDGLLTRSAFGGALERLQAAIDAGGFRPHCRVPMAFTVTRGIPWETEVAGLTVANQRFALPLEMVVDAEGKAWFVNHVAALRNESRLGQYLFLAETSGAEERRRRGRTGGQPPARVVPADLVLQAMLASSAFPLAFSPVSLVTCLPIDRCPAEFPPAPIRGSGWLACGERDGCDDFSGLTCDGLADPGQAQAPCPSRFVDGGFFDNVPLGVAMAQAELSTPDNPQRRPVDYVYFDPDVRRRSESTEQTDDLGDRGLARVMAILGEVATTARSYELSTVLRFSSFNRPVGWYARRFGELLTRTAASMVAEGKAPAGDRATLLGAGLDACLADLGADADAEGCAPLPATCQILADTPPIPPTAPLPTTPEAPTCVPRDPGPTGEALARLGRRLDCRARSAAHDRSVVEQHPPIMDHVLAWAERMALCLDRASPGEETMLEARIARDVALARDAVEALRRSAAPDRSLNLPSRFAELAAGQIANFGAFFDDPMRRHDYAVGVYDALFNLATWHCGSRARAAGAAYEPAARWRCVQGQMPRIRETLGVDAVPEIAAIVDALAALEQGAIAAEAGEPMPALDPLARCPEADDSPCAVQRALVTCLEGDGRPRLKFPGGTVCLGRVEMDDFLTALRAQGYVPRSDYMRRMFADASQWNATVELITRRLADVEEAEGNRARRRAIVDPDHAPEHRAGEARAQGFERAFTAAGSVLRAAYPSDPGVDIDPSTIPDEEGFVLARLMPYRLGVDPLQGGIGFGWEPRFGTRAVQLRVGLDPVVWQGRGRGTNSRAGANLGLRPWDSVLWGALSLGARIRRPWTAETAWSLSAVAGLDLLADRLRIELDYAALHFAGEDPPDPGLPVMLTISVLDLPGMLWLALQ